jgi:hypothetical protein
MATIFFPGAVADNITAGFKTVGGSRIGMGQKMRVAIGSKTVFRGVLLSAPTRIAGGNDGFELMALEEKWLLGGVAIGQVDVGTVDPDSDGITNGFTDVGFEIVFNKDRKPNKALTAYDFSVGSTAVYWTCRDVLQFLFDNYIPATLLTLGPLEVAHAAWDNTPMDFSLVGQTVLQAIDALVELVGETWAAIPGDTAAAYRSVRPGNGTARKIELFRPEGQAQIDGATPDFPNDVQVDVSIQNAKDTFHAHSAPIVVEAVYGRDNNLLRRVADFEDKEYAARYMAYVTNYEAAGLGADRSADSAPKKCLTRLVTRMNRDGDAYLTAAEIAADPTLLSQPTAEIPVWVSADQDPDNAVLCLEGYRIDADKGTIDFKQKLRVLPATGDVLVTLDITDWDAFGCWVTLATILEYPEVYATASASQYLANHLVQLIPLTQLTPERRHNSWLPDLAGGNNGVSVIAEDDEEKYVSVTDELKKAADAALAGTSQIETPIDARLPFFSLWDVGDQVTISGRNLGATGNEVIVDLTFDVHDQFVTTIHATNVMKAVNQSKIVGLRR